MRAFASLRRWGEVDRLVGALLLLAFLYNAYRYPLQINSTDTSPTYADTPLWLSGGKYLLLAAIVGLALLRRSRHHAGVRLGGVFDLLAYALLAGIPLVLGALLAKPEFLLIGIMFLVPLTLHFYAGFPLDHAAINRLLGRFVWLFVAVQLVQLLLFLAVGRLPALGYEGTVSVRFGSILDDPNSFGLLLAWLLPWAVVRHTGWKRAALAVLLLASLALTQSLTALIAVAVSGTIATALGVTRHPGAIRGVAAVAGAGAVMVIAVWWAYGEEIRELATLLLYMKQGSIEDHGAAITVAGELGLLTLLGIEPLRGTWTEAGYVNFAAHFGLPYAILYVGVLAAGAVRYAERALAGSTGPEERTFAFASAAFLGSMLVAPFGLPIPEIFPMNLVIVLLLGIASARLRPAEGEPAA